MIVAALIFSARVDAGTPLAIGGEFQVNTFTAGKQAYQSIAADSAGNFVVVWMSAAQDGNGFGVFGQRFNASGSRVGTEFQVNTYTRSDQAGFDAPDVASASDGQSVVVWSSGPPRHMFARLYDNAGNPQGAEFLVNSYTGGAELYPSVASAANGDFVVVWTEFTALDGSIFGIFGRRFDSSGFPVGGDFQVNSYTVSEQGASGASVASDASGNFVVVWASRSQDGYGAGLFGRRFDSSGAPIASEFQISTYTLGAVSRPNVASHADGDFVVVFGGSVATVEARRFDSNGLSLGTEFQVNTQTVINQYIHRKSIFVDADGRFTIVWTSVGHDGSNLGAFGQWFDDAGSRMGGEFQINAFTPTSQYFPTVAGGGSDFVVAWTSNRAEPNPQDGSSGGIFARRFEVAPTDTPTPIATDTPTATDTATVTPTATMIGNCPLTEDNACTTGFAKGTLLVKEGVPGHEKLVARMVKGPALAQTDLGNPLDPGGTVYSLCIYDDAGNLAGGAGASVVVERAGETCGGAACWSAVGGDPPGGKGYKYLDSALAADGVLRIIYKGGGGGKSKVIVKGRGPNLPDGIAAALTTASFATVQFRASDGICLSVAVDDVAKQTAGFFKAKFAAP